MTAPDEILRDSLESLADEARTVPGIAAVALARGRRMRRDRRIGAGLVVAVALAGVLVAVQVGTGGTGHPKPPAASGSPSAGPTGSASAGGSEVLLVPDGGVPTTALTDTTPVALTNGWWMYGYGAWALNPAHTRYTEFPVGLSGDRMLNAPAGRYTVRLGETPDGLHDKLSFMRTDGDPTDRFAITVPGNGVYQWSPDGTRLLTTIPVPKDSVAPMRIGIVDVATRRLVTHPISPAYDCDSCLLTWTRDGRSIVLVIADRSAGEDDERVKALQLFDAATGAPTTSLNVTGAPSGPWSFSPDGRYMVGEVSTAEERYRIFDLATGSSTAFPCDGQWVSATALLCTRENRIYTVRPDGTVTALTLLLGGFIRDVGRDRTGEPLFVFGPPPS